MARLIVQQLSAVELTAARTGVRPLRTPQPRGGQPHPLAAREEQPDNG
jgi:hypothetical protein